MARQDRQPPQNHAADHRPVGWNGPDDLGGPDPIDWLTPPGARPWFRQELTFAGTLTPLAVDASTEETLQFDDTDFGDDGDSYFAAITGPDRFNVLTPGWIHMYGEILFNNAFDSWVEIQMHDGGSFPLKQTFWNNSPQSAPTFGFSWIQRCEADAVEFKVCHGDASSQDISAAYVEMAYLGPWSGNAPHDGDPDF